MSSRQRVRIINDIFEMVSDNDEEIKFDEFGILKPVTVCKSTIVVVRFLFLISISIPKLIIDSLV